MSTVLVIDDTDVAFLLALAVQLKKFDIWLFAGESVEQAKLVHKYIGPSLDVLIVNCRVHGAGKFAMMEARRVSGLRIIGITSEGRNCDSFRNYLSATLPDHKPRGDREMKQWVEAIRGLLPEEPAQDYRPPVPFRPFPNK